MNCVPVLPDPQPHINADQLEEVIDENRRRLASLPADERSARRMQALDHMAAYAVMLREAADAPHNTEPVLTLSDEAISYTFKVEYEDGRWSIEEKELATTPRVGDVVSFGEDGPPWYVRASQFVWPKPSGKPARELFVCVPSV